jgi:hypothetical protein
MNARAPRSIDQARATACSIPAGIPGKIAEMLLQQERKEGAEDVAADGGVRLMKDRTRVEDSLALAKELLNLQQLTVAQYGLQWCHVGVGAQHEYAIAPLR